MGWKKILLISLGVTLLLISCGFAWYFNVTTVVTKTSIVREKYMYKDTDIVVVPTEGPTIGIPIEHMEYVLILENGSKHEVSWDTFWDIVVGDPFTYNVREWK